MFCDIRIKRKIILLHVPGYAGIHLYRIAIYTSSMDSIPIHNLPLYSISSRLVAPSQQRNLSLSLLSPEHLRMPCVVMDFRWSPFPHNSHWVITLVPRIWVSF